MNILPPGGYQYTQSETGMKFGGNDTFKSQVLKILAHRKGNHLGRATNDEVSEDVIATTCARLPNLCEEGVPLPAAPARSRIIPAKTTTKASKPGMTLTAPRQIPHTTEPAVRKTRKCGACGGRKAKA